MLHIEEILDFFLQCLYAHICVYTLFQIKAYDADEGENAMIRYELVRSPHGDIYDLDRHSGVIRLRRRPDGVGHHEITIKAYDGGKQHNASLL